MVNQTNHEPRLAASFAWTIVGSVGVLALNLTTGVLTARLLSADGRGQLGAIEGWALTASVLGSLGFREAATLFIARDPDRAPRVQTTTALVTVALAAITTAVTVLLVPLGFRAQSAQLVTLARWFMLWIFPLLVFHTTVALLTAHRRYRSVTGLRVGEPLLYTIGVLILWRLDRVTPLTVLSAHVVGFVVASLWGLVSLTRTSGWGRPERTMIGAGFSYGLRAHGQSLGQLANARLDLILLPAFVTTDEIGYYVVAVSAASVVVPLFGYLNLVVFPEAARLPTPDALQLIERTTRLVLVGSALIAIPLGLLAPWLLGFVYGEEFTSAATPMRILLPGLAFWACASVATSGLKAIGRPGAASIAQLAGLGLTVVGLFYALPRWGITGAATVSSLAYTSVFALQVVFLRDGAAFSARRLGRLGLIGDDARYILAVRDQPGEPPAPKKNPLPRVSTVSPSGIELPAPRRTR